MTAPTEPIAFCLLVVLTAAAVYDFRCRRVPNPLVGGGLAMALVLQCALHGPAHGVWIWFAGSVAGMGLLMVPWLLRLLGAGDVKLLGAVGGFVGPTTVVSAWLASCLAGALLAAFLLFRKSQAARRLRDRCSRCSTRSPLAVGARSRIVEDIDRALVASRGRVHYPAAIAAGTLLAIYAGA
jgi:prepilin peptidase CpaA